MYQNPHNRIDSTLACDVKTTRMEDNFRVSMFNEIIYVNSFKGIFRPTAEHVKTVYANIIIMAKKLRMIIFFAI